MIQSSNDGSRGREITTARSPLSMSCTLIPTINRAKSSGAVAHADQPRRSQQRNGAPRSKFLRFQRRGAEQTGRHLGARINTTFGGAVPSLQRGPNVQTRSGWPRVAEFFFTCFKAGALALAHKC